MSGRFWLISFLTLIAVLLVGFKIVLPRYSQTKKDSKLTPLSVGEVEIKVLIADEADEMEKGLGFRDSLDRNEGMLFVYQGEVIPRYWMKGMRFDLDLVWIRSGAVIDITQDVKHFESPPSEWPLYSPNGPVDMVLEVNSGYVAEKGIKIGDLVELK